MVAALFLLALNIGVLPGSIGDVGDLAPATRLPGTGEWFALHPDIHPEGVATRTSSGDWNGDLNLDLAVLIDDSLFVVVAPGAFRGGQRIDTEGSISDFEVLPGGGPEGQDALITVGSAGLVLYYYENNLDRFVEVPIESNAWLAAKSVRVVKRPSIGTHLFVGVAADPTHVIGFDPIQGLSMPLLIHSAPIDELEVLDWVDDLEQEFAVMSGGEVTVYDIRAVTHAQFTAPGESSIGITAIYRDLESYARVAWITRAPAPNDQVGVTFKLRLFADGIVEPVVELGSLSVVDLVAGDLDGDGSDELFLSHDTSEHQVILRSQALPGNAFSDSYDSQEFDILTALPVEKTLVDGGAGLVPVQVWNGSSGQGGGSSGVWIRNLSGGGAGTPGGGGATVPGGTPAPLAGRNAVASRSRGSSSGFSRPVPGLPLANPFLRNRSVPALGDFDNDGDIDLVFPISGKGDMLFHRNGLVDHRSMLVRINGSTLNSAGPDNFRLDFTVLEPEVVAPNATHLELVVWHADAMGMAPDQGSVFYKKFALGGEWPESLDFLMEEHVLPFHDMYHMQIRLIALDPELEDEIIGVYPTYTSTYTSSQPTFEALLAMSKIRGGGITTPKTGPVFVGGIVPRPHLDPFAPGILPRAPGGGQVK